jgi:hypothetical protein
MTLRWQSFVMRNAWPRNFNKMAAATALRAVNGWWVMVGMFGSNVYVVHGIMGKATISLKLYR